MSTSAVTSCRTSQSPSSRCQCVSLSLSLSAGSDPRTVLKTASLLHAHRSNVHYCYYSSLVNQRSRDQTISHHTRWKPEQLNICWVTQTYSTTFSYFGDECMEFFSLHCWCSEFMKSFFFFFWCCTRTQLHLLAWEVENGLKRNERFAEECTEVDSSEDFYCLHVFNNKQTKKDEDGNYHFLWSFRQEG